MGSDLPAITSYEDNGVYSNALARLIAKASTVVSYALLGLTKLYTSVSKGTAESKRTHFTATAATSLVEYLDEFDEHLGLDGAAADNRNLGRSNVVVQCPLVDVGAISWTSRDIHE